MYLYPWEWRSDARPGASQLREGESMNPDRRFGRLWKAVVFVGTIAMVYSLIYVPVVSGAPAERPLPAQANAAETYAPTGTGSVVFEREFTLDQAAAEERAGVAPTAEPDITAWNLPQEDLKDYRRDRDEANAARATEVGDQRPTRVPISSTDADPNDPPSTFVTAFDGFDQEEARCFPPDSDGAVGALHYVEIVNCRIAVYRKSDNVEVENLSLQTHFDDSDFVFDPRMVYDQTYKRWVSVVTRAADSATDTNRYLKLAVTNASNGDASQNWFVYRINFSGQNGEWCDYPQLGIGQDSILVTCNNFQRNADGTNSFTRTMVFGLPKARVYNGWGFSFPIFSPSGTFSIAPPVLTGTPQQQNDNLFFLMADNGNDQMDLFRMNDASHPAQTTFVKQANIGVTAWDQPFDAFNCGGGGPTNAPSTVDALEGRIQQNIWQNDNSNSLWAVHSEALDLNSNGSLDTIKPVYFQINPVTNSVTRRGIINSSSSGTIGEDEFNASLATNPADQVFAVWNKTSSTDSPCLWVMRGGCEVAALDCDNNIGDTALIHTTVGAGPINNSQFDAQGNFIRNRWGDYSSVEPDPSNYGGSCTANKRAWASIERVAQDDGNWDNRILVFGFC